MPKIAAVDVLSSPNTLGTTPHARGNEVESSGGALYALGSGMQRMGEALQYGEDVKAKILRDQQEQDALTDASKRASQAAVDMDQHLTAMKGVAIDGAPRFTPQYMQEFDAYTEKTMEGVTNPRARRFLFDHLASLKTYLGKQAVNFEAAEGQRYQLDTLTNSVDQSRGLLFANPDMYELLVSARSTEIAAAGKLEPNQRRDLFTHAKKSLRHAGVMGAIDKAGAQWFLDTVLEPPPAPSPAPVATPPPTSPGAGAGGYPDPAKLSTATQKHAALAITAGAKYDVDPNFLLAQIEQESRGDVRAVSDKGAEGISQFIPATARQYGVNVKDAASSIDGQAHYMADLLKQFGGDYEKAAAAYNWGPSRVAGAIEKLGDNWKGALPKEPRDYLAQIFSNLGSMRPGDAGLPPGASVIATIGGLADLGGELAAPSTHRPIKPLTGIAAFDDMTPEEQDTAVRHAQTLAAKDTNADKAIIHAMTQDATAMAPRGQVYPNPPSAERIMRAYGQVEGPRMIGHWQRTTVLAQDAASFKDMPASQMMATVDARTPKAPEGFADAQHYQNERIAIAKDILTRREKDAAAYVGQNSSRVSRAWASVVAADGGGDPVTTAAAMQSYVTESLAEQRRLGIRNTAILTNEGTTAIVDAVSASVGNGDAIAQQVLSLEQRYGPKLWPDVYRELASGFQKDRLPDSFLVIPMIASPGGREEAARIDGVKMADLVGKLNPGDEKDLKEKINKGLAPFRASLPANPMNMQGSNAVTNMVMKIAADRMTRSSSAADAAEYALQSIVGHLAFPSKGSSAAYRVPVTENPDQVADGAQLAIDRSHLWNLAIPPDHTGKMTATERADQWGAMVVKRPLWVTNGDETGMLLYTVDESGRPVKVNWSGGKQVGFSWAEFRSYAEESRFAREHPPISGMKAPPEASSEPYIGYRQQKRR